MNGKMIVALAAGLLLAAGCSINPATGGRQLVLIPESQEVAMGVQAGPQFEKEFGGRVGDSRLQEYLGALGRQLAAVSDRPGVPWDFTLVASDVPNAFALPGGRVFVTAGLFRSLGNERQLAAVVGHEIGHVCAKHNVMGMQRQMGAEVFTKVAQQVSGNEKVSAAAKVASSMAVLKYSRDDEYQADALGVKYMEKAGANPWGMVETLEFLMTLGGKEPSRFEEMFSTHPLTGERVRKAREKVSSQYKSYPVSQPDTNRVAFQAMQKLLPAR